jgi:cysteine desulfurase
MLANDDFIYLDNNSTTQTEMRVFDAMFPYLKNNYANSSSTHYFGLAVNEAVKNSRIQVASLIGADENEIIFTSGSTESINIALKGVTETFINKGKHIVTLATEHKAVLDTSKYLETRGFEVTYLPVAKDGLVDLVDLQKSVRVDTILVCIMFVNNETGVIQPIKEIGSIAHAKGALFMSDTTQAVGKIKIDVDELNIDLLCFSGHKMYAPKGIGALYMRNRTKDLKLPTFIHGGGHEKGIRSGTLNVPGVIALAKACEIAQAEMEQDAKSISDLRDELETEFLKLPGTFINGNKENRIYNVTNICFPNVDANVLIGRMKNIAVSNGSACTSAVFEPSHVLSAMGLSNDEALGSLRFSLGKYNTRQEILSASKIIKELIINQFFHA